MNRTNVELLKAKYRPGTVLKLIQMDDPQATAPGTKGKVTGVDDIGNILMEWENGSTLNLIPGVDKFEQIL